MKTHRQRCEEECTRDVIFLFQVCHRRITHLPDGIEPSDDGLERVEDEDGNELPEPVEVTMDELRKMEGNYGEPFISEQWFTEGVWLDREEAERFGTRRDYRYGVKGKDWRVYGVPANGELAKLLQANGDPQ